MRTLGTGSDNSLIIAASHASSQHESDVNAPLLMLTSFVRQFGFFMKLGIVILGIFMLGMVSRIGLLLEAHVSHEPH